MYTPAPWTNRWMRLDHIPTTLLPLHDTNLISAQYSGRNPIRHLLPCDLEQWSMPSDEMFTCRQEQKKRGGGLCTMELSISTHDRIA